MVMLLEKIALWYLLLHDFLLWFCFPNWMMVYTNKEKVPYTYKELLEQL